jgi:hypothetical protein
MDNTNAQGPRGTEPLALTRLREEDLPCRVREGVAMTTATGVGYVQMRIAKVVGLATAEDQPFHCVVLEER